MRVLDDDRDLAEHSLETDVQVLDRVGGEVVILEHLDGIPGHPISLEGEETLRCLSGVCKRSSINVYRDLHNGPEVFYFTYQR